MLRKIFKSISKGNFKKNENNSNNTQNSKNENTIEKQLYKSPFYMFDEKNLSQNQIEEATEIIEEQESNSNHKFLSYEKVSLTNKEKQEYLKNFLSRRSIRKFQKKNISRKDLVEIVEAGLSAPKSLGELNSQIIIVNDKNVKNAIAKMCLDQMWIEEAPYLLVVLRDDSSALQHSPTYGKKFSIQATAGIIENILLMSHLYGYGACWVGAFNEDGIKDILKVPSNFEVDAIIPVGFSDEIPQKTIMSNLENIVSFNTYDIFYANDDKNKKVPPPY